MKWIFNNRDADNLSLDKSNLAVDRKNTHPTSIRLHNFQLDAFLSMKLTTLLPFQESKKSFLKGQIMGKDNNIKRDFQVYQNKEWHKQKAVKGTIESLP